MLKLWCGVNDWHMSSAECAVLCSAECAVLSVQHHNSMFQAKFSQLEKSSKTGEAEKQDKKAKVLQQEVSPVFLSCPGSEYPSLPRPAPPLPLRRAIVLPALR